MGLRVLKPCFEDFPFYRMYTPMAFLFNRLFYVGEEWRRFKRKPRRVSAHRGNRRPASFDGAARIEHTPFHNMPTFISYRTRG